ncbi:MAG: hypothetical protein ACERKX_15260, partial [Anaerolineales bacterium]
MRLPNVSLERTRDSPAKNSVMYVPWPLSSRLLDALGEFILNVVFDLGGVVFSWRPDQITKSVFEDKETQERVMSEIFAHQEWLDLDKGILNRDEAIERGAMRTKLPRSKISELMQQIPLSLTPIRDTVRLIHSVKRNGHKVFVLSNMHLES